MASVRRYPGSLNWFCCYTLPDGKRVQRTSGTPDKRRAIRIANRLEDAARAAKAGSFSENAARKAISEIFAVANHVELPSSTLRDFVASWLKRKELEASPKTHERYQTALNQFVLYLGPKAERAVARLSQQEIASWRDDMGLKRSASTSNLCLKILRAALNDAKRDRLIDSNPAELVQALKVRDEVGRRPFTLDELRQILSVASLEWRGLVLAGLYLGGRLGDLAQLTWANVDLGRGEIAFTTQKTNRRQVLPMAPPLIRYLQDELRPGDNPFEPLFPSAFRVVQEQGRVGTLSNQFHDILVAAGLAAVRSHQATGKGRSTTRQSCGLSFHCLRHTATSLLKNAGVSDVIARDIIGHDSRAISEHYTHVDTSSKRRAVDLLPDITGHHEKSR